MHPQRLLQTRLGFLCCVFVLVVWSGCGSSLSDALAASRWCGCSCESVVVALGTCEGQRFARFVGLVACSRLFVGVVRYSMVNVLWLATVVWFNLDPL